MQYVKHALPMFHPSISMQQQSYLPLTTTPPLAELQQMALANTTTIFPSSIFSLFISFSLICLLSSFIFLHSPPSPSPNPQLTLQPHQNYIKVYVSNLPRSFNYGLLQQYWSLGNDTRRGSDVDNDIRKTILPNVLKNYPPYPENPTIKQFSVEYWILCDLMTPEELKKDSYSFAKRVFSVDEADVVYVPFFAAMSAELQLGCNKGVFKKKVVENEDYQRQRMVVDSVMNSEAWRRSGGRDHVFGLMDPLAMWHVRHQIASAIFLVVDFGGWYKLDSKSYDESSPPDVIRHTQVSLLKDVIVPYTPLLPSLRISEDKKRHTLMYFKGAKHRHRGGAIREKLWDILVNEPGVVMEEGYPNATGKEQAIKGMRTSEFCLQPAGDTPTSCRYFDAVHNLCIPVTVSDDIVLPFEGMVDYTEFSIFVSVNDALKPNWLVSHLRSYSNEQKDRFRRNMAKVQQIFRYDNGRPGGIGPIPPDGPINYIWRKVHQKLPMVKEAIFRERRKPPGVVVPLRCHCM